MYLNGIFNDNRILEMGMQGLALRNEVIQNNIANAELPNFKRSNVIFEDVLQNVVQSYRETGRVNLSRLNPRVVRENTNLSYRLDGNNVDIEAEMVGLYVNDAKYQTLVGTVINNYRRFNLVLSGR